MKKNQPTPGERLRMQRWATGLSLRDVHTATVAVAKRLHDEKFIVPIGRLYDLERGNIANPNIFRLFSLARVYGLELAELLSWYGIPRH